MFDATTSDNSLESSHLFSNDFALIKSDSFLNLTSLQQLSPNTNFDIDYSDRAVDITNNSWDNQIVFPQTKLSGIDSTLTPQSTSTNSDPLTGMAVNDSLVGNAPQAALSPQSSLAASAASVRRVVGNLRANRFIVPYAGYSYVLSGNGNVDFGSGYRDYIDLSNISYKTVGFNFARATGGGVLHNPGNGIRVFDAMRLSNGTGILFEGMDSIRFREGFVNLSVQPNDPYFDDQWNLHMMGVQNAWRFTRGSTGVLIGVQDTGLGLNYSGQFHGDLGYTYFYTDNYGDEYYNNARGEYEYTSHGTAVQGIIAAKSNNGYGISGINWNSSVFNIDVLGSNNSDQSLAQAAQNMINFANSRRQKLVINMSLGIEKSFGWTGGNSEFLSVVANNPNVLFVIAAGNYGHLGRMGISDPAILARYFNNVISVGASWGTYDDNGYARTPGQRISYPGRWGSQYGPGLTLMGPSEVPTTEADGTSYGGAYWFGYDTNFNGTSAATPNVAGVASLVWSANRNLSAGQVKAILSRTSFDLGARGYDYVYGSGFVNADAAVRQAMALARIGYSSSSTSSTANALGANLFASNASLSANSLAVNPVWVAYTDRATPVIPSLDSPESVEFGKDNPNSDRTYLALSLTTSLQSASHDAITGMTNLHTTQLVGLNRKASHLLGDGLDVYSPLSKKVIQTLA